MSKIELDGSTMVVKAVRFRHFTDIDGSVWFVAKDVCDYLNLADVSKACERVWDEYKRTEMLPTTGETVPPPIGSVPPESPTWAASLGPERNMSVVSEPGLYRLIFMSRKEEAIDFQKWIFSEVLPALRRDGFYRMPGRDVPYRTIAPIAPSRFGRQPFMDIIRKRGISQGNAFTAMNSLEMPGIPQVNTTYQDQIRGGSCVRPALALRASAYLELPVEDLFTEASRARLPQVAANV